MTRQKRLNLNLATHPHKNRRLFFLLFGILGALFLAFLSLGGYTYWVYSIKNNNFERNWDQIEKKIKDTQREERRLTVQIEEAEKKYQNQVSMLNTLILKKSFSWVDFLSALEEALPESCYIVSLEPFLIENNQMEVRLEVAAPNLDELLKLNRNLFEKNFSSIRMMSESTNEAGLLVSEISLVYERTF
jgi:Tfp pilus assembly protein PilN